MKKLLIFVTLFLLGTSIHTQSVGINTPVPDASAALDISSTSKGILIPRMSSNDRLNISSPAEGLLVYDETEGQFFYYKSGWSEIGSNILTKQDSLIYYDSIDDIFLFGADEAPIEGISNKDTLLYYNDEMGALRTGIIFNNPSWAESNLGLGSLGSGMNVEASGNLSAAFGNGSKSQGLASVAFGSGSQSLANYSMSGGIGCLASGGSSVSIGQNNISSGLASVSMGLNSEASGSYATAIGQINTASGSASTALGSQTTATRTASTAMGILTNATGTYSTAAGRSTNAEAYNSFALGRFNIGGGSPTIWNGTDPLFEIGNGSSAASLSNALTVLKNGNVGIGTETPDYNFELEGRGRINLNSSSGNVQMYLHELGNDYSRLSMGNTNTSEFWTIAGIAQMDSAAAKLNLHYSDYGNVFTAKGNGSIGVGTSNPSASVHINSTNGLDPFRIQNAGSTKLRLFSNNAVVLGGNWSATIANTFKVRSAKMMIGFSDSYVPNEKLEIDGAIKIGNTSTGGSAGTIRYNDVTDIFEGHNGVSWTNFGEDGDGDPTNEYQNLYVSGNNIGIINGNSVTLPGVSGGAFIENGTSSKVIDTDRNAPGLDYIGVDINSIESFILHRSNDDATLGFINNRNIGITGFTGPNFIGGTDNTSIGNASAATTMLGDSNIVIGNYNLLGFSGNENIVIGNGSGTVNSSTSANVILGSNSGQYMVGDNVVAIGTLAGNASGNNNVFIGNGSGANSNTFTNGGGIGYLAKTTTLSQYVVGNIATVQIGGYEPWSNLSDGRFKINVKENIPGLNFITALRPVSYEVDGSAYEKFVRGEEGYADLDLSYRQKLENADRKIETGFIAQEVAEIADQLNYDFDGVIRPKNEGHSYSLAYATFVVPLVKSVQELNEKVDQQQEIIDQLLLEMQSLKKQIGSQEK